MGYFNRAGAMLLAAALFVAAVVVAFVFDLDHREAQLRAELNLWQNIYDTTEISLSTLKDVETGQRGFIITGSEAYLEPYYIGRAEIERHMKVLSLLAKDQPSISSLVADFTATADQKLQELKATVDARRAGEARRATDRVVSGEGRELMEHAREDYSTLKEREQAHLHSITREANLVAERSTRTVMVGGGLLILLIVAASLLLARETAREGALRASLEEGERRYRSLAETLEEQVQFRTEELLAVNKELEAFSFSVSHDLRAPLRSIDGFSHIVLEDYGDKLDESGRNLLIRIRAAAGRMGQLIRSLLELSRVSRAELRRSNVSVTEMASGIVEGLRASDVERNVTVEIQPGLEAQADPDLTYIVLENLLSNAWKFTAKQDAARIEVASTANGRKTAIFVRDNGTGFDPAYADRLFTPFQRLHAASEFDGIGIGLATVKRVIHRHSGELWAESKPGDGATFFFTLS